MKPKLLKNLVHPLIVVAFAGSAGAATRNYDGGTSGTGRTFSASANWDAATASGDDLFVGSTALTTGAPTLGGGSYLAMNSTAAAFTMSPRSLTFDNSLNQFPVAGLFFRNSTTATAPTTSLHAATLEFTTAGIDILVAKSDSDSPAPLVTIDSRATTAGDPGNMSINLNYSGLSNFSVQNLGTLTIDGSNSTAAMITGTGGIQKTGNGTLSLLSSANTFSGGLTISQGVVSCANPSRLGSSASLNPSAVVINGGILRFNNTGSIVSSSNRGFQVGSSGGTIDMTDATVADVITISGVIGDVTGQAGSLLKTGVGTLALTGSNTFTGGLTLNQGILQIDTTVALGSGVASNPSAVVINGGTLQVTGSSGTSTSVAERGFQIGSSNATFDVPEVARTLGISGAVADVPSQAGHLIKTGLGTLALNTTNSFTGGMEILQGIVSVDVGDRLGSSAVVNTNAIIINGGTLRFSGTTNTNSPSANRGVRVGSSGGTIDVDSNKIITLSSTIRDVAGPPGNFTKSGTGTLILTSANHSYTGTTTLSAGTTLVNSPGVISMSAVTLASGATLGGTGQVTGGATINGHLQPGPSTALTPGTLTLGGTVQTNSGSDVTFEILSATTSDKIAGTANITLDGTVAVSLLSGYDPAAGASFDLIDASSITLGSNFAFSLPALTGGKTWNTSNFASSGVISVNGTSDPFTTWATTTYGLSGGDAATTGDPDHDGFNNLQEFTFGTSPISSTGSLVTQSVSGPTLTFTYIERNSDVTYTVLSSADLTSWIAATGLSYAGSVDQTGVPSGYTRKQFTKAVGSKEFLRIKATY